MQQDSYGRFRVILLTPSSRLLDCRVGSLILPAYDGQIGILRNHAPMVCELGLGLMYARQIPDKPDRYYMIEGGFVRVCENNVTVLAYDVTTFEGMEPQQAADMLAEARQIVVGSEYIRAQKGPVDYERAALISRMGELAGIKTS